MMSSTSALQGTILQQIGGTQRPPPPLPDQLGGVGSANQAAGLAASEGDRPAPPPEAARNSQEGGEQGGQFGGADPQSVLQGLFDALETSEESAKSAYSMTSLLAADGYSASRMIFG